MVVVNDIEFAIYELDTPKTFMSRLANEFDTLPKYLYFPNGLGNFFESKQIEMEDILKKIKNNASKSTDFLEFLEQIRDKLSDDINIERDILYVWLSYNTVSNISQSKLKNIGNQLVKEGYFSSLLNFMNFWNIDRENIRKKIENSILMNKTLAETQTEIYETLEETNEKGIKSTELDVEHVKLDMKLDLVNTSLLELFNYVVTRPSVPFAKCKQYYKILKDFVPLEEWSEYNDDILTLKVSEKKNVNPYKYSEFHDVGIYNKDDELFVNMKLNMVKGNLNRDDYINRVLKTFKVEEINYRDEKETEIAGVFYYPQKRINTYIFSDLIMNDPLFSYLINTDESSKTTKKKSDKSLPWLYIYFNHPSVGKITAGITQKTVMVNDLLIREKDSNMFPVGSYYIRIRVKGRDRQAIETFKIIMSKLLQIYDEKQSEISAIYQQYLPPKVYTKYFKPREEKTIQVNDKKLKNIAPKVFVKKYSRRCNKEKMPTIISADKVNDFISEGKQVIKFPRDERKDSRYPSDGVDQHYYVCNNPKYPYPGLQTNTLENSDDYPFVPCCFSTNQINKPVYQHYYEGKLLKGKKVKVQQDLIKTNKFLGPDKYGDLPKDISQIFELIDPNPKYKYIRLGVNRNYSSFLHSVMLGMYIETNILDVTKEKKREKLFAVIRDKMSSFDIAPLCRQSIYDSDIKTISQRIGDPNTYLDPNLYLQLLESEFDCNIFLFNQKRMVLPRHLQSYYSDKRLGRPCIFIYEHWGSESDHAKYPQCELIVRWELNTTNTTYSFSYVEKVSRGIRMLFSLLRKSYVLDKPNGLTNFPLTIPIKSQFIDSYGKCRHLEIETKQGLMSLIITPIAPRKTVEQKNIQINYVSFEMAKLFLEQHGDGIRAQTIVNGVTKELIGQIGTVEVTIPIINSAVIEDVPTRTTINYPLTKESKIKTYNKNKKTARYIVEYCLWLFSKYYAKNGNNVINDELINKFALNYIKIDPEFVYKPIRKKFSRKGGVMKDKKLIVPSQEALKRLIYVLRLYSVRNTRGLIDYCNKKVIQNYYQDITDFEQHQNQIILYGERAIEKWISEIRNDGFSYKFYNHIVVGNRKPYFFKNNIISDNVFLAQNIESLDKALSISLTWQKQGYNESVYANKKQGYNFTLYSYVSSDNISSYRVIGDKDTDKTIRIIGYKIDNTPFYTALLELYESKSTLYESKSPVPKPSIKSSSPISSPSIMDKKEIDQSLRPFTSTFTITYGDQAENHVGMQKIGSLASDGLTYEDLLNAKQYLEKLGSSVDIICLNDLLPPNIDQTDVERAYILIARKGVDALLNPSNADDLFKEQDALDHDKKAYMYGRVVNKKARHNLCFDEKSQDPDYKEGKGRVVPWNSVPLTSEIREMLPQVFGPKTLKLTAEGNYYYDISKCGIGFHGDSERKIVVAIRLGATLPIVYRWFKKSEPVGNEFVLQINHGDLYAMSEKATGNDWKLRSKLTLRHAAGCSKYTTFKKKKSRKKKS